MQKDKEASFQNWKIVGRYDNNNNYPKCGLSTFCTSCWHEWKLVERAAFRSLLQPGVRSLTQPHTGGSTDIRIIVRNANEHPHAMQHTRGVELSPEFARQPRDYAIWRGRRLSTAAIQLDQLNLRWNFRGFSTFYSVLHQVKRWRILLHNYCNFELIYLKITKDYCSIRIFSRWLIVVWNYWFFFFFISYAIYRSQWFRKNLRMNSVYYSSF